MSGTNVVFKIILSVLLFRVFHDGLPGQLESFDFVVQSESLEIPVAIKEHVCVSDIWLIEFVNIRLKTAM